MMPAFFGTAAAWYAGYDIQFFHLVLTLIGAGVIHSAGNLVNDIFDYKEGIDREVIPVSGAIVRGLMTPQTAALGAAILVAVGVCIGLYFIVTVGIPVLWIGLAGTALAVFYTAPPFQLKYRAFGDLVIFLSFAVGISLGSWYVQTGHLSWTPAIWAVPQSMLVVGILHANNWRDIVRDSALGARSVAQLFGAQYSYQYYVFLTLGALVLTAAITIVSQLWGVTPRLPWSTFVVVLAVPETLRLVAIARERPMDGDPPPFIILDAMTARLNTRFGLLFTAGLLLGRGLGL
jgi:1,4-dihydroxy-2-naphthoate octaprenyltransferase